MFWIRLFTNCLRLSLLLLLRMFERSFEKRNVERRACPHSWNAKKAVAKSEDVTLFLCVTIAPDSY